MAGDPDLVSDSWRLDQEIMRRNAAPPHPAMLDVDDLIRFLDQALRLSVASPAPPVREHPNPLI